MKLVLPTNKQTVIFIKYSLILGVSLAILMWFFIKQDPLVDKSKEFIKNNQDIARLVGKANDSTLFEITYVDDAIDYDGVFTAGYKEYRYKVTGNEGSITATIRADKIKNKVYVFSLEDVTKY